MSIIEVIILGIIEGITEFLPISSTGHMILASNLMGISHQDFVKTFEIAIQLGAILSVLTVYYKRFLVSIDIYLKLIVAFIPTGIIGLLLYKIIKGYLFNVYVVSTTLVIGGILLILLDRWSENSESKYFSLEDISYLDAIKIGFIQCISMIPGVSRAAATIFGGIYAGYNRVQAAEFSFLLAIPTMVAATGYSLYKGSPSINGNQWTLLIIGGVIAFIFAFIAVKTFITLITRYGFKFFGYYRIILGVLFLVIVLVQGIKLG